MTSATTTICAFCHVALDVDEGTACGVCGTQHHSDCWQQNEGCAVALCEGGPKLPYLGGGVMAGGAPVDAPVERHVIDFDGDERRAQPRRRPPLTPIRVGAAIAALVVVVGLVALIAHGSPSTSPPTAGAAESAAVANGADHAAVAPLPNATVRAIASEKRRVRRGATHAATADHHAQQAARIAARRRAAKLAAQQHARSTSQQQQQQQSPTTQTAPTPRHYAPNLGQSSGAQPRARSTPKRAPRTEQATPLTDSFD